MSAPAWVPTRRTETVRVDAAGYRVTSRRSVLVALVIAGAALCAELMDLTGGFALGGGPDPRTEMLVRLPWLSVTIVAVCAAVYLAVMAGVGTGRSWALWCGRGLCVVLIAMLLLRFFHGGDMFTMLTALVAAVCGAVALHGLWPVDPRTEIASASE